MAESLKMTTLFQETPGTSAPNSVIFRIEVSRWEGGARLPRRVTPQARDPVGLGLRQSRTRPRKVFEGQWDRFPNQVRGTGSFKGYLSLGGVIWTGAK